MEMRDDMAIPENSWSVSHKTKCEIAVETPNLLLNIYSREIKTMFP